MERERERRVSYFAARVYFRIGNIPKYYFRANRARDRHRISLASYFVLLAFSFLRGFFFLLRRAVAVLRNFVFFPPPNYEIAKAKSRQAHVFTLRLRRFSRISPILRCRKKILGFLSKYKLINP